MANRRTAIAGTLLTLAMADSMPERYYREKAAVRAPPSPRRSARRADLTGPSFALLRRLPGV